MATFRFRKVNEPVSIWHLDAWQRFLIDLKVLVDHTIQIQNVGAHSVNLIIA
jgi:hypothetical protein